MPGNPPPFPRHEPPKLRPADFLGAAVFLAVVLALVGAFFYYGNRWSNPTRLESLPPPVRATRTADEQKVRDEIESSTRAAIYTSTRKPSQETTPPRRGPEPRPGVSVFQLCNFTPADLNVYVDGVEILSVEVPSKGSLAIELRSGEYDIVIAKKVGSGPPEDRSTPFCPLYRRAKLEGTHHMLVTLVEPPAGFDCARGHHEPTRRVP